MIVYYDSEVNFTCCIVGLAFTTCEFIVETL